MGGLINEQIEIIEGDKRSKSWDIIMGFKFEKNNDENFSTLLFKNHSDLKSTGELEITSDSISYYGLLERSKENIGKIKIFQNQKNKFIFKINNRTFHNLEAFNSELNLLTRVKNYKLNIRELENENKENINVFRNIINELRFPNQDETNQCVIF